MKKIAILIFFICATTPESVVAQINFVKNPSFEKYDTCPYNGGQIFFCKYWQNAISPKFILGIEYYNKCAVGNIYTGCPNNGGFYQNPHSGNGMAGASFFYDKTFPPPPAPAPFNNREYLQENLFKSLSAGKTYCVTFWVNLIETAGYGNNKIGAYLDNGSINTAVDSAGKEITSVLPQVYTDSVIIDTANWVKIEGSFVATGNESYITIGNFATNAMTKTIVTDYFHVTYQYSYYLIDDVSVIPIDSPARAGADAWVEQSKKVQIGRVGDTTTLGLDCKWYKKGVLIDSGAIISVNANAVKYAVDTYVVVQTICGVVTRDTVLVKTVGLGVNEFGIESSFAIYPNPSNGTINITITSLRGGGTTTKQSIKIYDLLGRVVYQEQLLFNNKEAILKTNLINGSYIVELQGDTGNVQRERIVIQ